MKIVFSGEELPPLPSYAQGNYEVIQSKIKKAISMS